MCEICNRVKEKKYCFYEDELVVACLALNQVTLGKSCVYYKKHIESLFDLSQKERDNFFNSMMKAAEILNKKLGADHFNYSLLGNYYKHLHWHLIPRFFDKSKDNFFFESGLEPCHLGREIKGRYEKDEAFLISLAKKLKD